MIKDGKIDALVESKEYWKAKEKLAGRFAHTGYDIDLLESTGFILLKMQDKMETGKYLFLSGVRKNEYSEAIELFLDRYSKKDIHQIFHTFPKAIQKSSISEYPENVVRTLEHRGFTLQEITHATKHRDPDFEPMPKIYSYLLGSLGILFLIGLIISAMQGLIWFFKLFL
ncbi:MAG: hypothetical protein L3J50_07280 [Emcibacter sp.]|nr:hypothetical protein [Emcibacter sp.]